MIVAPVGHDDHRRACILPKLLLELTHDGLLAGIDADHTVGATGRIAAAEVSLSPVGVGGVVASWVVGMVVLLLVVNVVDILLLDVEGTVEAQVGREESLVLVGVIVGRRGWELRAVRRVLPLWLGLGVWVLVDLGVSRQRASSVVVGDDLWLLRMLLGDGCWEVGIVVAVRLHPCGEGRLTSHLGHVVT